MLKRVLKDKKGFTLIELIVVIAMLAILIAIAVPSFLGFTDKANKSNDDSLRAIVEKAVVVNFADGTFSWNGTPAEDTITVTESGGIFTYSGGTKVNLPGAARMFTLEEDDEEPNTSNIDLKTELEKVVGKDLRMKFYDSIEVTISPTDADGVRPEKFPKITSKGMKNGTIYG